MRKLILGLLTGGLVAGLAACTPWWRHKAPAAPAVTAPLRDHGVMISSVVAFDPARFSGTWYVAQSGVPGCAGARQVWTRAGNGWTVTGTDCGGAKEAALSDHLALTGPGGRFMPGRGFGGEKIWVLWADDGYRVAVLGTPSGKFGMILTRTMPPRADLVTAARRVLDFNGYDMRRIGR